MSKTYYVYILASKRNGTLYIGVTNDLERRVYEHENYLVKGFTEKYNVHMLVYFEQTSDIQEAIQREKQLKKWNRGWKLELIEKLNPEWMDLSKDWIPDQVGDDNMRGGAIAGNAKHQLEQKSGQKVSTSKNYLKTHQSLKFLKG